MSTAGNDEVREYERIAAALAESEERYRAVLASLEEGVTLHDAEGRILAASPSAADILGVAASSLVGLTLTDPVWRTIDANGRPLAPEQHPVSVALAMGNAAPVRMLGVHDRHGELHWLQLIVTRTVPAGAVRVVCSFTDITFARHEEEEHARTEANFRTLIELTPDAMAVYQEGSISYVNPRMVRLLGYAGADALLGKNPEHLVYPDDRIIVDRLGRASPALPESGVETASTEERFLRADGSPVPVEVTTLPIRFDSGPATLVHARDLTERKRLEAQVVLVDRLASVGRLAAAVGHEINNPLAYVMANLDLALERFAEHPAEAVLLGEIVEMLREAREGADRVRHIVRDLKVFIRGETEERTRVDARRVIDSCVNMARSEIRQRARVVKCYGDTPPVIVNEARLGQVVLNLLVNAAHAIPEGDPEGNEIRVTTRCDDSDRVVIEVRDTGAGIPDHVKPRLFEPFFTTKGAGKGTGLGLSICKSIVTALGGEIGFESQLGQGTTFYVVLPAAPPGTPADPRTGV